ncbi:MAG: site-2 protease family protein [Gammaproteobacteria bacterium]|nr:MAG: site-2 protease family protein [Gammaproteobacteria bacterium]RLA15163.1 MAG: site-2 protease family protein [Gammaproteobacteria bacterium]
MFQLLLQQQYSLFILIITALILSLTFHEYGHGIVAKFYGDDTAEKAGRLTLNPLAHIDPVGLLMVVLIGFGYAKPVPTNPAKFTSPWATLWVAAAGPAMNLILAIVVINFYQLGLQAGWSLLQGQGPYFFFTFLALINLLLMLFNLIPIGPLDGHYILPYFLPRKMAIQYMRYNQRYGVYALLALVGLNFMGIPVFATVWKIGESLLSFIIFV